MFAIKMDKGLKRSDCSKIKGGKYLNAVLIDSCVQGYQHFVFWFLGKNCWATCKCSSRIIHGWHTRPFSVCHTHFNG